MTIKLKLISTCIFIVVGIIVLSVSLMISFERIRVNGPVYREISRGKDLIADILPPPEYIIEANLVVLQALAEKNISKISSYLERFKKLHREYDERQNYWRKELPAGKIKDLLLEQSNKPAVVFFNIATNDFFPALAADNHSRAEQLMNDYLSPSYESHRKVIDEIVTLSNAENSGMETRAAGMLRTSKYLTAVISVIVVSIILAIFFLLIRNISGQLGKAVNIANSIADGDLTVEVQATSKDEIGQLEIGRAHV